MITQTASAVGSAENLEDFFPPIKFTAEQEA